MISGRAVHHPWCGSRCRAGRAALGEHRSDPVTALAGSAGGGAVTGTRTASLDGRHHLELRISVALPGPTEHDRAATANRALCAITAALTRAI